MPAAAPAPANSRSSPVHIGTNGDTLGMSPSCSATTCEELSGNTMPPVDCPNSANASAASTAAKAVSNQCQDAEAGGETNALAKIRAAGDESVEDRVSLAESIRFERSLAGVRLRFDGYTDTPLSRRRGEEPGGAAESGTVVIRYRANGTVRPHRWYVCDEEDEDDRFRVTVNAVGRPALHPEGREER